MRDVIPGTLLIHLVLGRNAIWILREIANDLGSRATPPPRIRIAPEYRSLNLVL